MNTICVGIKERDGGGGTLRMFGRAIRKHITFSLPKSTYSSYRCVCIHTQI